MTLAARLAAGEVLHMPARVTHARRGAIRHAFTYRVDYLLFAPATMRGGGLLSRNRANLFSWHDRDHGGPRGRGEGAAWAERALAAAGVEAAPGGVLALLTQPRFLGRWFTPVSFWLAFDGAGALRAAIAEVNNTFGQRHSYICRRPDGGPIGADDVIGAAKVFHVSPFQDVAGDYRFRFALEEGRVAIAIAHTAGAEGVDAAMAGPLAPVSWRALAAAALRRPGGGLRVLGLIHWNALRLWRKGARFRRLPPPPEREIS